MQKHYRSRINLISRKNYTYAMPGSWMSKALRIFRYAVLPEGHQFLNHRLICKSLTGDCCFREGHQIKNYQAAWHSACKKTNLIGKLLHDNRRTAVRNMSRAGIPDTVTMKISGHKTRSVFDRYNITSEEDLRIAAEKIAKAYQDKQMSIQQHEILSQFYHNRG